MNLFPLLLAATAGAAVACGIGAALLGQRARTQRRRFEALVQACSALAEGRFETRLSAGSGAAGGGFGALATSFDAMATALQAQVTEVMQASGTVQRAGDDMSMAAQTLAIRTEEQSQVIDQTSQAIDDVLMAVRGTSDMASQVDEMSRRLCDEADRSETVVGRAVQAMERIRRSTQEMSQHLGVIDELTFQTNLLAVNAAIEAARAGPAGRGFAVVAGEVRALASRTAEASKQIKTMIERSNGEVAGGVREIDTVREAISFIGRGFRDVSQQMRDVSGNNLAQSAAIGLISEGLDQLLQITQASSQLVVASVAASEQLRGGAGELRQAVGQLGVPLEAAVSAGAGPAAGAAEGVEFF